MASRDTFCIRLWTRNYNRGMLTALVIPTSSTAMSVHLICELAAMCTHTISGHHRIIIQPTLQISSRPPSLSVVAWSFTEALSKGL